MRRKDWAGLRGFVLCLTNNQTRIFFPWIFFTERSYVQDEERVHVVPVFAYLNEMQASYASQRA